MAIALTKADDLITKSKNLGSNSPEKSKFLWFEWTSKTAEIDSLKQKADLECAHATTFENEANMHSAEKELWYELQATAESMEELYTVINATSLYYMKALENMDKTSNNMVEAIPDFDKNFPGLREKMLERLK